MFFYDEKGIKINHSELFLDAYRKVPFSFVSHGHADHLKNHHTIIATPATILFHRLRARHQEAISLEFEQPYKIEEITLTLYPAGHILGSAMIRIERQGVSLLYSGDFKMKSGRTSERIVIPQADILIMESTYGNPDYCNMTDPEVIKQELFAIVEDCFRKGQSPIILAYALGKSQEAMKILGEAGYAVRVYHTAWEIAQIYRQFGIQFPNCALWRDGQLARGEILIMPPQLLNHRKVQSLPRNKRTTFLSGWANSTNVLRGQYDHALPLSDHADFNELIEFVRQVNPRKVYTTHGFEDFPDHLRSIGFDAEYLRPNTQIEFA